MKESMFNILIGKIGDDLLFFNTRTCAFVKLSEQENEILKRGIILDQQNIPLLNELESGGFLLPDGKQQELKGMELSYYTSTHQNTHLGLTILPTLACNCKCPYCFEHKTGETMPDEVLKATIEHVAKMFEKNKRLGGMSVSWFGGEPLLEANAIEEMSKAFIGITEKNNASYSASIISNGTLMDEDMAKRMASLKISSCQFTLDGS
ncbi:MAG: radical SAM protein, partial [Caldiserica bacterium]|nr:radical SAM protein [Caldisericota bacterium]